MSEYTEEERLCRECDDVLDPDNTGVDTHSFHEKGCRLEQTGFCYCSGYVHPWCCKNCDDQNEQSEPLATGGKDSVYVVWAEFGWDSSLVGVYRRWEQSLNEATREVQSSINARGIAPEEIDDFYTDIERSISDDQSGAQFTFGTGDQDDWIAVYVERRQISE